MRELNLCEMTSVGGGLTQADEIFVYGQVYQPIEAQNGFGWEGSSGDGANAGGASGGSTAQGAGTLAGAATSVACGVGMAAAGMPSGGLGAFAVGFGCTFLGIGVGNAVTAEMSEEP